MADCKLAGVCFGNLEMSTFLEEKMDVRCFEEEMHSQASQG